MILEYFLVFWFLLGMVLTVAHVGRPRTTLTPIAAAVSVVINLALVGAVLLWWPS